MKLSRFDYQTLLIACIFTIALLAVFGARAGWQEPKVDIQLYVIAVDNGADVERHAIEQAGDQFTYPMSESTLRHIQQTPFVAKCVDGLSITSVWTEFAENEACPGSPHVRVVLIAPY